LLTQLADLEAVIDSASIHGLISTNRSEVHAAILNYSVFVIAISFNISIRGLDWQGCPCGQQLSHQGQEFASDYGSTAAHCWSIVIVHEDSRWSQ
jgi:hypothetical protein